MSRISIPCPDCGKKITVEITTIDTLRIELEATKRERDIYRARLAALETMSRTRSPVEEIMKRMGL